MGRTAVADVLDRVQAALTDRYRIEREVGRGATATVYLARDLKHDRPVALKVLFPELVASIGAERFLREIRIESRLQHPHIVGIHDSGEAGGFLYCVMPYIAGESLRDRLARERQLRLPDVIAITRDVGNALDYAHKQDVVHRDIKPGNILLSGEHAYVADFGTARAISAAAGDRLTEAGFAVGTPEYMSPEQAGGDADIDGRSDIYALGCVVYEMLVGEPPFTGRTAQAVVARHMQQTPPSVQVVRPDVPRAVRKAVETALAKAPADRFSSARAFVEAMAAPEPRPSRPAPSMRAAGTGRRRRYAVAAGFALLLIVAAAVARRALTPSLPPPDANKVMVFPLADYDPGARKEGAGEAVGIMIGSALEHTEPLRWLDGWTRLDERVRGDVRLLSDRRARAISLAQGARFYVDGSIIRGGDSATVVLLLHDAAADSTLARASAAGAPGASLPQLGLRAAAALLPALLAPGRVVDPTALDALAGRRPAAIASWLQGEREYRLAKFSSALEYYRRAVGADSAMALAALKGAQAASWTEQREEAERLVRVALAHGKLLAPKYASFARGLDAYLNGRADSAVSSFRRALAADPAWGEAWMGLGEAYYHLLPREYLAAPLDSLAEAAFTAARRVDPGFTPPLFHLAEIALRRGDAVGAEQLTRELRSARPDSAIMLPLGIMIDCVRDGAARVRWGALARTHPDAVFEAAKSLSVAGSRVDCSVAGFRAALASDAASPSIRWSALFGLQSVLVAQARFADVRRLLDSAVAGGMGSAVYLYVLDADAGADMGTRPADVTARLVGDYAARTTETLWFVGTWAARRGDAGVLAAIVKALSDRAEASGPAERLLADEFAARLALVRGDTARAVALLRALASTSRREELTAGLWEPASGERAALASVLLARGDLARARLVAASFDHQQSMTNLLYLPASLVIRLRAAERSGRPDLARTYRKRLEVLGRRDLLQSVP